VKFFKKKCCDKKPTIHQTTEDTYQEYTYDISSLAVYMTIQKHSQKTLNFKDEKKMFSNK